jgi:hypothetical protein
MGGMRDRPGRAPRVLWLYLVAAVSADVLAALPSSGHSSYRWLAIAAQLLLLLALFRRLGIARLALVVLAALELLATIALVGDSAIPTALAFLNLVMIGLLLAPSMQQWTNAGASWDLSSKKD